MKSYNEIPNIFSLFLLMTFILSFSNPVFSGDVKITAEKVGIIERICSMTRSTFESLRGFLNCEVNPSRPISVDTDFNLEEENAATFEAVIDGPAPRKNKKKKKKKSKLVVKNLEDLSFYEDYDDWKEIVSKKAQKINKELSFEERATSVFLDHPKVESQESPSLEKKIIKRKNLYQMPKKKKVVAIDFEKTFAERPEGGAAAVFLDRPKVESQALEKKTLEPKSLYPMPERKKKRPLADNKTKTSLPEKPERLNPVDLAVMERTYVPKPFVPFAKLGPQMMDIDTIQYTQGSISPTYQGSSYSLFQNIKSLYRLRKTPEKQLSFLRKIPSINVIQFYKSNGTPVYCSLDNRRLFTFQKAEISGMIPVHIVGILNQSRSGLVYVEDYDRKFYRNESELKAEFRNKTERLNICLGMSGGKKKTPFMSINSVREMKGLISQVSQCEDFPGNKVKSDLITLETSKRQIIEEFLKFLKGKIRADES